MKRLNVNKKGTALTQTKENSEPIWTRTEFEETEEPEKIEEEMTGKPTECFVMC